MDQEQINAMRAVIGGLDETARVEEGFNGDMATFRLAVEGLRDLVERAAVERAAGVAVGVDRSDAEKTVQSFLDSLHGVVKGCDEQGGDRLIVFADGSGCCMDIEKAREVGRAIEALLAAKPTTPEPAEPTLGQCILKGLDEYLLKLIERERAEPTLEECVAAINRRPGGVAGITGWKIRVSAKGLETRIRLSLKEVMAMGRIQIDRERAEAAKGGA